jgi:hypothetical protein
MYRKPGLDNLVSASVRGTVWVGDWSLEIRQFDVAWRWDISGVGRNCRVDVTLFVFVLVRGRPAETAWKEVHYASRS